MPTHTANGDVKPWTGDSPLFEVQITREGTLLLNGEPSRVTTSDAFHEAILDTAQKQAQLLGRPVTVAIDDHQARYSTLISVAPDGSSRPADIPDIPAVAPPEPDEPEKPDEPVERTWSPPAPPARRTERPDPPSFAGLEAETPSAPGESAGAATPPTSRDWLGDLEELIEQRIDEVERQYGPSHANASEVYGLAGYVAYMRGDYELATALFLRVTSIRQASGDPRAQHEIKWATLAWTMLHPTVAEAYDAPLHGLWADLAEDGLPHAEEFLYDCYQQTSGHMESRRLRLPDAAVAGHQPVASDANWASEPPSDPEPSTAAAWSVVRGA